MFLLWVGLTGLIVLGGGDTEAFLQKAFGRHARADAFEFLNRILPLFWTLHSALLLATIEAARLRRPDVFAVILIGPAIALALNLFGQDWSDPNWYVVVAICTICWLVSLAVGIVYWALTRAGASSCTSHQAG